MHTLGSFLDSISIDYRIILSVCAAHIIQLMLTSANTAIPGVKAIISDFSGLMLDDLESTWNISNDVFVRCGKSPITLEEFREGFELPYFEIFQKRGLSKTDSKETSIRIFHENYHKYEDLTKPFDHTKSFFESLRRAGYLLGIVSQTPRKLLDYQLGKMGLDWMIPNSIAKGESVDEKPLPMPLFQIMDRLEVSRHQVLYLGDMAEDVICAHFAGVRSVAVANEHSYHTAKKLNAANPDYIVSNLGVLQQILAPEIKVIA